MLKLKKKKLNFWINICFVSYLLISSIFIMVNQLYTTDSDFSINALQYYSTSEIIFGLLFLFIFSLFIAIFKNIFLIVLLISVKIGLKKVKRDKLSNIDFVKYKGYYRDIISNHSVAVLSYIDDFEIDNKDIIATLLELKLKGYISISNNKIEILNHDYADLNEIEKYIIENLPNYNMSTFRQLVIEEANRQGLLNTKLDIKRKIKNKIILSISVFILLRFLFYIIPTNSIYVGENPLIIICVFIVLSFIIFGGLLYPIFSSLSLITYIIGNTVMPYVRTKKGEEVNEMLEGLKNYLKDFSIIDKRNQEEIEIWNEYLIYSVLFNQNKTILKEFEFLESNNT